MIDIGTGTGKLLFEWSRLAVQPAYEIKDNNTECKSEIHYKVKCNNQ